MSGIEHVPATTFHGRRGAVRNAFRYGVDYVLIDPDAREGLRGVFAREGLALWSVRDRDHGGAPGAGQGSAWLRAALSQRGLAHLATKVLLLTQPRVLGHVFNPVSFWFVLDGAGDLRVMVAEVTNTFGDRHSYLCHRDDLGPIGARDTLRARKIFHVSPFQDVAGGYAFRVRLDPGAVAIHIAHDHDGGGLVATLEGPRVPLTARAAWRAVLRRPFGARRVLALIHWQALKLWWKGARYRARPSPPAHEISDGAAD